MLKRKWSYVIVAMVAALVMFGATACSDTTTEATSADSSAASVAADSGDYNVGDSVETDAFKITFVSTGEYVSDNEYLAAEDGYMYWQFEFLFENISDEDQTVSSMLNWECYADNANVEQTWMFDSGLDATLSAGRTVQGSVYFEVPTGAESIELEYSALYQLDDTKLVFIGK